MTQLEDFLNEYGVLSDVDEFIKESPELAKKHAREIKESILKDPKMSKEFKSAIEERYTEI